MKFKKKLLFPAVISACILGTYFNVAVAACNTHAERIQCQNDLKKHGRQLKVRGQGAGLPSNDEKEIRTLGNSKTPNYKMIKHGAVSALGVGFRKKNKPDMSPDHFDRTKPEIILLNSLSGEEIKACVGPCVIKEDYPLPTRNDPDFIKHEMVKNAIEASRQGAIKINRQIGSGNNRKNKDVTYLVTVQAIYEGSYCQTTYYGGRGYQFCFDRFW